LNFTDIAAQVSRLLVEPQTAIARFEEIAVGGVPGDIALKKEYVMAAVRESL
jgi:hypothetical protein